MRWRIRYLLQVGRHIWKEFLILWAIFAVAGAAYQSDVTTFDWQLWLRGTVITALVLVALVIVLNFPFKRRDG